jgi:hypothetical protein
VLEDENMRKKLIRALLLCFVIIQTVGCERLSRPNIAGVWKGSIEASDKSGHKWNGPAELTLNQNGDALTGSFAFTHPQGGRVQIPISSGVVSKDSVTFAGEPVSDGRLHRNHISWQRERHDTNRNNGYDFKRALRPSDKQRAAQLDEALNRLRLAAKPWWKL